MLNPMEIVISPLVVPIRILLVLFRWTIRSRVGNPFICQWIGMDGDAGNLRWIDRSSFVGVWQSLPLVKGVPSI